MDELGFYKNLGALRKNGVYCQSPLYWIAVKIAFLPTWLLFSALQRADPQHTAEGGYEVGELQGRVSSLFSLRGEPAMDK